MLPKNSSTNSEGCTPTSSNCIIWQGPDLQCINLCKGDTISEVVQKIATHLCSIQDSLGIDLSDVDFKCLLPNSGGQIEPGAGITDALQLLIDQTCILVEAVDNIQDNLDVTVTAPTCLNLRDASGNPLTLSLENFALILAQRICELEEDNDDIQTQLALNTQSVEELGEEVEALKNAGKLKVIPQCTSLSSAPKDIDDAYEELESAFCNIRSVLGGPNELIQVLDNECAGTANGNVVYSLNDDNQALWVGGSNTVSDTMIRMWKSICDLRSAVRFIQDSIVISADDIIVDFDYKIGADRQSIRLFFDQKTFVPIKFYDKNALGHKFTIRDSEGNVFSAYIKLRTESSNDDTGILENMGYLSEGYLIDLSNTSISATADWDMTLDAEFTDGETTALKCVRQTNKYVASQGVCEFCTITATGTGTAVILYE